MLWIHNGPTAKCSLHTYIYSIRLIILWRENTWAYVLYVNFINITLFKLIYFTSRFQSCIGCYRDTTSWPRFEHAGCVAGHGNDTCEIWRILCQGCKLLFVVIRFYFYRFHIIYLINSLAQHLIVITTTSQGCPYYIFLIYIVCTILFSFCQS